ncbi:MAG: UDP-glucose 4-epimerase GalE [Bacteroidales bacterium]|nr:UDP-glucose 4-epimerase GalE [Bacteroidales bacterium]
MKHKILVTGGCGYLGSHTIIALIQSGKYEVVSVDSCVRSTPETMNRVEVITGVKVKNYQVDICDKEAFFKVFEENPDMVGIIHFAAFKAVGESMEQPLMYYRNNLGTMMNVLEACEKFSVKQLLFSSSSAVYGDIKNLPVSEQTPLGVAACPYAHTKQICEGMIQSELVANKNLNALILRYFNPVGAHPTGLNGELSPGKPNNLIPVIMHVASGILPQMTVFGTDYDTRDGSCIRDYLHVCDIADAHVKAMSYLLDGKNSERFEIFNLGSGNGLSVLEMLSAAEKVIGKKLNYVLGNRRPGDIPAIYSDCTRANEILGWRCQYDVADMMESAWKWEQNVLGLRTED